jgi:hypothetical protein
MGKSPIATLKQSGASILEDLTDVFLISPQTDDVFYHLGGGFWGNTSIGSLLDSLGYLKKDSTFSDAGNFVGTLQNGRVWRITNDQFKGFIVDNDGFGILGDLLPGSNAQGIRKGYYIAGWNTDSVESQPFIKLPVGIFDTIEVIDLATDPLEIDFNSSRQAYAPIGLGTGVNIGGFTLTNDSEKAFLQISLVVFGGASTINFSQFMPNLRVPQGFTDYVAETTGASWNGATQVLTLPDGEYDINLAWASSNRVLLTFVPFETPS